MKEIRQIEFDYFTWILIILFMFYILSINTALWRIVYWLSVLAGHAK